MSKDERTIAIRLAQRDYDRKILEKIHEYRKKIKKQESILFPDVFVQIYEKMPEAKRILVTPYFQTTEMHTEEWFKLHEGCQNPYPIEGGYLTEQGEVVRSKSEKIIADKLFYKGIPYLYESKLILPDGTTVYPDFTILKVSDRETVYLEHMGMMDDPEYCRRTLEKLDRYELNGIHLGTKLYVTMECSQKGIDMRCLDILLERMCR